MQLVRGKHCMELKQDKFRNLFTIKTLDDPALAKVQQPEVLELIQQFANVF